MKHNILLFILFLFTSAGIASANDISFKAAGPSQAVLDQPFKITFTVNAKGKDFRLAALKDFDVLAGPFEGRSSNVSIVNGQQTSSVTYTYSYTLLAKNTGTFTIPSASITINNQKYTSNGLSIQVLPANAAPSASPQGGQQSQSSSLSKENLFIRTIVTKTTAYEQEAILLTYRLYSVPTNDINSVRAKKIPDFKGFMKNDIDQKMQIALEDYNGKRYQVVDLYQAIIFPQRAGTVEIEKADFEVVLRVQNRNTSRSFFDSFFDSYTNVSRDVSAPAIKINVNELPVANKPMAFSGTVGDFRMTSSISTQELKVNEAVTLKINIEGSGNMRLIKTPTVKIPESFEQYDPKVNNDFKISTSGVNGKKTIEYLFIPRHSGEFEIPPVEFIYFDIQSKTYKTLSTPSYSLNVLKGEGGSGSPTIAESYVGKEDVKQLGSDIRYIHTQPIKPEVEKMPLVGSIGSWLMYLIPLVLSILIFLYLSHQAKQNSDIKLVKNRRANKIARKRLQNAQKLLNEGKKDQFHDEVLKAVWSYISDKLSIPAASLTKENVASNLSSLGVSQELINELNEILNTCEFARYAPNSGQQEMGNLYDETIQVISKLEEHVKK